MKLKVAKTRKQLYQARFQVNQKNDRIQEMADRANRYKQALMEIKRDWHVFDKQCNLICITACRALRDIT